MTSPKTITLGRAKVSVLNLGYFNYTLGEILEVPRRKGAFDYKKIYSEVIRMPSQCALVELGGASILIDAGDYGVFDASHIPKGYKRPPALVQQLRDIGVEPEAITHVVITHAHHDHFAGVADQDKHLPAFPNACYFLGRKDWENQEMRKKLRDRRTLESRTLGAVHEAGLLELVDGEAGLVRGVTIIPAPGESQGHQIVRLESDGSVLYCLGDLVHHPIEVSNPELAAMWADKRKSDRSKRLLIEAALRESALLLPAHIEAGRLEGTARNPRYVLVGKGRGRGTQRRINRKR